MSDNSNWHGTTIVLIRKGKDVVVAGDGQVTIYWDSSSENSYDTFMEKIGSNPNDRLTIINSSIPKIVNNHLQYVITWAILGLLFLVMNYIYSKRH